MKQLVDFLPVLVFVGLYVFSDIYVATAGLMLAAAGQILLFKIRHWPISRQMWVVFWVAIISGSLTLIFQNKLFIQWKPTIVYWVMASALVGSRLIGKGDAIRNAFGKVLELPDRAWVPLTYGWASGMLLAGIANLYVAYGFDEETWVTYKLVSSFVLPVILSVASIAYLSLTGQLPEEATAANTEPPEETKS